jgi:hypothetical protein
MGRLLFGGVLAVIGLLYLWVAGMALFGTGGFLSGGGGDTWLGLVIFLAVGIVAAAASVNLLREKRR